MPAKNIIFAALSSQCQVIKMPGMSPLLPLTVTSNYNGVEMPRNSVPLNYVPSYKSSVSTGLLNTVMSDPSGIQNLQDCPNGAKAKIEMIEGIALVEQHPIARIQLNSADMCLNLCKNNAVLLVILIKLIKLFRIWMAHNLLELVELLHSIALKIVVRFSTMPFRQMGNLIIFQIQIVFILKRSAYLAIIFIFKIYIKIKNSRFRNAIYM